MKNKIVILIIIIVVVAAAVAGFYFIKQKNIAQEQNQVPKGNQEETKNGPQQNNQKNTGNPQTKIITDYFSVDLPTGWQEVSPSIGVSAMAVNASENINDPAIKKINFKSYFAVSFDTLQGKSLSEYSNSVKSEFQQVASGVVFSNEQDIMINGQSAHAIEADLNQQEINFKILMVVIAGQENDVWVITFNTTKSSWDGYKEIFSEVVKSFVVKK